MFMAKAEVKSFRTSFQDGKYYHAIFLKYNGEEVVKGSDEVWKPNMEVELTLHYQGYGRGRSAVTFYWVDDDGHKYPMFIKDVDELLRQDIGTSSIHAIFTYVKRGANYGIKFLRRIDE